MAVPERAVPPSAAKNCTTCCSWNWLAWPPKPTMEEVELPVPVLLLTVAVEGIERVFQFLGTQGDEPALRALHRNAGQIGDFIAGERADNGLVARNPQRTGAAVQGIA